MMEECGNKEHGYNNENETDFIINTINEGEKHA